MRVSYNLGADGYKTVVKLTAESYDASPAFDSITYHTRMRVMDPNIGAVSAAIALQNHASRTLDYSESVQVHVADAIEDYYEKRNLRANPISQEPALIPLGARRALLGEHTGSNLEGVRFTLGNSHSFSSYSTVHEVHIASNISLLMPDDEAGRITATISAATFVAADYAFGELCLSKHYANVLGDQLMKKYQKLLRSINIKLSTEE